jgi:hypothetical protein
MSEDQTFSSPLSIQNIPLFVRQELSERQGKSSISSSGAGVFGFNPTPAGSQQHPKMVWSRVTSNYGNGFVFASANDTLGFKNTYNTSGNSDTIIGYDATVQRNPITIKNDTFKNRPIPGIESIENDSAEGESRNFRVSTIKWTCWSKSQLDALVPYFLNPGVSVVVEYGWVKGPSGLNTVDITNVKDLVEMAGTASVMYDKIKLNKGNYDVSFGFITNFTIDPRNDGGYNCVTTIKHPGGIYSGLAAINNAKSTDPVDVLAKRNETLSTFLQNSFDRLPAAAAEYHKGALSSYPVNEVFYGRKSYLCSPAARRDGKRMGSTIPDNPNLILSIGQAFDVNRKVKVQPPPIPSDSVEPYEGDFDNDDDWWISLNHFFYWINTVVAKDNPLYRFDIDKSVISAHINLKSVNGKVLLVPNARSPEKFLTNETDRRLSALNKEISKLTERIFVLENIERDNFLRTQRELNNLFSGTPSTQNQPARNTGTISAPQGQRTSEEQPLFVQRQNLAALEKRRDDILKNASHTYEDGELFMKSFTDAGGNPKASRVIRSDLNKIINWWASDQKARAFPAIEKDDEISESELKRVGYLKNLYVHRDVVKAALSEGRDVKHIVLDVLEKINVAAGNIWSFEIVPLTSVGTSRLTVVDRNSIHKTGVNSFNELYDFPYISTDGFLNKVLFSVKSADSQTTNTIFEAMRQDGSNLTISQYRFPFAIGKKDGLPRDRLFNPTNFPTPSNQKTQDEEDKRKELEKKRAELEVKPTNDYTYTISKSDTGDVVYATLVEPDADFMKSTMYGPSILSGIGLSEGIVQPGLTLEVVLQGISGWRTLQCFRMTQLLDPYGKDCVFQIKNVKHVVQSGKWETALECAVRLKISLFDDEKRKSP